LAARRITKLIRFTEENDRLRAEYVVKAKSFTDTVAKVQVILNDRTIDNTMAGAKAKIAQFYEYKVGVFCELILIKLLNNIFMCVCTRVCL
jgi:hypothetical protein